MTDTEYRIFTRALVRIAELETKVAEATDNATLDHASYELRLDALETRRPGDITAAQVDEVSAKVEAALDTCGALTRQNQQLADRLHSLETRCLGLSTATRIDQTQALASALSRIDALEQDAKALRQACELRGPRAQCDLVKRLDDEATHRQNQGIVLRGDIEVVVSAHNALVKRVDTALNRIDVLEPQISSALTRRVNDLSLALDAAHCFTARAIADIGTLERRLDAHCQCHGDVPNLIDRVETLSKQHHTLDSMTARAIGDIFNLERRVSDKADAARVSELERNLDSCVNPDEELVKHVDALENVTTHLVDNNASNARVDAVVKRVEKLEARADINTGEHAGFTKRLWSIPHLPSAGKCECADRLTSAERNLSDHDSKLFELKQRVEAGASRREQIANEVYGIRKTLDLAGL